MGVDLSEGFPEEITSELDCKEHVRVLHVDKGGKATACPKAESGNSMLCSKNYKQ